MSWGWGDFVPTGASSGPTVTPPDPIAVPVVHGDDNYHDIVAEAIDRLAQQFKDSAP